jgi:hypothetical protein
LKHQAQRGFSQTLAYYITTICAWRLYPVSNLTT